MAFNPQTGLLEPDLPGQSPPGGIPPLTIGQPPAQTDVTSTTGPSTITHTATPLAKQAQSQETAENAKRQEAADRAQAEQEKQLAREADAAEKQAQVEQDAQVARQQAKQEADAEIARRQQISAQKQQQMEAAAHPTSYWEDKGAPGRILAGFLVGLNTAAGGKGAYEAYKDAEETDKQRKIQDFTRSKEFVDLARNNVEEARSQLANKLKDINDEAIVKGRVITKQLEAMTKRMGTPAARAAFDEAQAKIRADEQQRTAANEVHYAKEVNSGHKDKSQTLNTNKQEKAGGGPDLTIKDENGDPISLGTGPAGTQKTAVARDPVAANALDTSRAGTVELVRNMADLKRIAQLPFGERAAEKLVGDEKSLREKTKLEWLRATTGRINHSEIDMSGVIVPKVNYVNGVKDPAKVYDQFVESALQKTAAEVAAKSNMSVPDAEKLVRQWAAQAVTPSRGGQLTQAPGATPEKPGQPAGAGPKVETKVLSTGRRAYRVDGGEWKPAP